MLFYMIIGTNLLTQSPVPVSVFPCFSVSQKRNIKRSPNGMKPSGELFLEQSQSRRLGVDDREASRKPRGREARPTPWARHRPTWAPRCSPDRLLSPYMSIYPKNTGEHNRSGVSPPQASVATKNQSGPYSGILPEGESLTGGHLHHPGTLHDEEGVLHPRG